MILTKKGFPVISLQANFGERYRVKRDECGDQFIPHKWGSFYAYSATELACFMDGRKKFNNIQEKFPTIKLMQDGDQEVIFVFDPKILPKLATALKVSRKKHYSEESRKKMRERLQEARKVLAAKRVSEKLDTK